MYFKKYPLWGKGVLFYPILVKTKINNVFFKSIADALYPFGKKQFCFYPILVKQIFFVNDFSKKMHPGVIGVHGSK